MKPKLALKDLITDQKLADMRLEYNKPSMTRQEAYRKLTTVSNFIDTLLSFSKRS